MIVDGFYWVLALSFLVACSWWWCNCPTAVCQYCSVDTETLSVTFSDIQEGSCVTGCSALNATFVLDRDPDNHCHWMASGNWTCGGSTRTYTILVTLQPRGGSYPSWFVGLRTFNGAVQLDAGLWYESPVPTLLQRDCTATVATGQLPLNDGTNNSCYFDWLGVQAKCQIN